MILEHSYPSSEPHEVSVYCEAKCKAFERGTCILRCTGWVSRRRMVRYKARNASIHLVPPCSIRSTPPLTTPTRPPVCTTSPPPPLKRNSTSARPCSHATLVCGGTSNLINSSPSAVNISAKASPLFALRTLTVFKQVVRSDVSSSVSRIILMSEGCGAATQSKIVSLVIGSRFGGILGVG